MRERESTTLHEQYSHYVATEAETALLGALLLRPQGFVEVAGIVAEGDFLDELHRRIFCEAQWMYDCTESVDLVLLKSRLGVSEDSPEIETCISAMESVPSVTNAYQYAKLVREAAKRRHIGHKAMELAKATKLDADFQNVLSLVDGLASLSGDEANVARHISQIDSGAGDMGITTTYPELDRLISTGGFPIGQTTIARAYHKGGKTTFMMSCALRLALRGKRVLYATFADLSGAQLRRRWLKMLCGWSTQPDSDGLAANFTAAVNKLDACDLVVYDSARSDRFATVEAFSSWVRGTHEVKPYDVVFVDYAQKVRSVHRDTLYDQVLRGTVCSSALADLAARAGLPVVVGSQVTLGGGREVVAITKGSRGWEEDAGWVLGISTPDNEPHLRVLESVWSRFGIQGVDVTLRFNEERVSFE